MKTLKKIALATLASAIGLTFGCSGQMALNNTLPTNGAFSTYKTSPTGETGSEWTILVHLGADNNLDSFGTKDLAEMTRGLKSSRINVIVLYDGAKNGDSAIYKIVPGGKEKVDDGGAIIPASNEINSGDPALLAKFTEFAIKKFPAHHYMLDLWDHGSGIFKDKGAPLTRNFCYDDNGTNMKTKDLNLIMGTAAQAAGKKIDILGFDACLMGHLEIAYQVKDSVNILVASEETEPGDGWDYEGWLKKVEALETQKCALTPAAIATALVDSYGEWYNNIKQNSTLAAIDVNGAVGTFLPVFNQFAADLKAALPASKAAISTARTSTQSFSNANCADYGDFLKKLQAGNIAGISEKVPTVMEAYKKTIIKESHTGNRYGSVAGATGMVVYFPKNGTSYSTTYDNPKEILFGEQPTWGTFLKEFVKK